MENIYPLLIPVFQRKVFRGQTTLGITANFRNKNEQADAEIEEIGGLFRVFNPQFFNHLKGAGIDLENFVYKKNDTHYFVMTAKKGSLLQKKVLRQVRHWQMEDSGKCIDAAGGGGGHFEYFYLQTHHRDWYVKQETGLTGMTLDLIDVKSKLI